MAWYDTVWVSMTQPQYDLVLSLDALRSMIAGEILELHIDGEMIITLKCDDPTVESFRDHINKAMLALLPTPPLVN
jgi:hypothetical protein